MSDINDIAVVIVTWNSAHLIARCLEPFDRLDIKPEVIVYDNASSDNTVDMVRSKFPWATVIAAKENIGFGRANNVALRNSRKDIYVLLNPDAFVESPEDILTLASNLSLNPKLACVGPRLINADGSHQVGDAGWRTTVLSMLNHTFWVHKVLSFVPSIYLSNSNLLKQDSVEVDWICGACLVIRRTAWHEMNGFDDKIFMYGEDVDLGERLTAAGWDCLYVPRIKVMHLQGGTQGASTSAYYSAKWMHARARRFAMKRSKLSYFALRYSIVVGFLFRFLAVKVLGFGRSSKSAFYMRFAKDAFRLPSWQQFRAEADT